MKIKSASPAMGGKTVCELISLREVVRRVAGRCTTSGRKGRNLGKWITVIRQVDEGRICVGGRRQCGKWRVCSA